MTVAWAAAAFVFAVLASGAARAAEELLAVCRVPRRWVWSVSLFACVAVPAVTLWTGWWPGGVLVGWWPGGLSVGGSAGIAAPFAAGEAAAAAVGAAGVGSGAGAAATADWPVRLALAWAVVSALLLLRLFLTWRRLARARSGWSPAELYGERILLTGDVGPAVAGLRSPALLIPSWLLAEPEPVQRLILRHEREHVRAGDPWLLALAPLVPALMPWNVALWWQLSRLRLSVELDCDARVLRSGVPAAAYGALLLEVAERRGGRLAAAASLAEPRSFLERRIMAMSARRSRRPVLRATSAGLSALLLLAAAFELAAPLVPDRARPADEVRAGTPLPGTPAPGTAAVGAVDTDHDVAASVSDAPAQAPDHHATPLSSAAPPQPLAVLPTTESSAGPGPEPSIVRPRGRAGPLPLVRHDARAGSASPLIVVDGVIMSSRQSTELIDVADVAEVEVVKASAASRLYGSRAAGGVIRIRTRRDGRDASGRETESATSVLTGTGTRGADSENGPGGSAASAPATPGPLIVIDGVVADAAAIQGLDPADISRIEVVKGAAGTARWGVAGRNGVVLVTTVRGAASR